MGADKDIPTVFQCQNTQLRKLTWSARTVGPSGRTSVHHTPSCLLRPKREGGTTRKALAKPLGQYSSIWPLCLPPACSCWAVLNEARWMRTGLGKSGPLGARRNGSQPTLLWSIRPCYLPTVTNALEVPSILHCFTPVCPCTRASAENTLPF